MRGCSTSPTPSRRSTSTEGAYLLDQCAEEFPAGTIFVAVVDPQVGTDRDPILIETGKGKYFVGPDNGLFSAGHRSTKALPRAWKLDKPEFFRAGDISHTFHGRDIFGPVAAHLAAGTDPDRLGTPVKTLTMLPDHEPTFAGGMIAVAGAPYRPLRQHHPQSPERQRTRREAARKATWSRFPSARRASPRRW